MEEATTYSGNHHIALSHADTFGVFDKSGNINASGEAAQGLYHEGTRFISFFAFTINEKEPHLLNSAIRDENELFYANLTNPTLGKEGNLVPAGSLHIGRSKFILNRTCFEKLVLTNYGKDTCCLNIEFSFEGDFKDIFETRGLVRKKRGKILAPEAEDSCSVILGYRGLDKIERSAKIRFSPKPDHLKKKVIAYTIELASGESYKLESEITCQVNNEKVKNQSYSSAYHALTTWIKENNDNLPEISSANETFNLWLSRSKSDLISLLADKPGGKYPYAGVPWYNTVFGRDALITALKTLWASPRIAKGVLCYLAATQAKEENLQRAAEPGKIVHEMRGGEMANLDEIPFKLYYGTVDATPLFVMLAGAYYRRTADKETIEEIWPAIKDAVEWIENYGDIDRDGFVEYIHKAERGLFNQGWKDSEDAVFYEDGRIANPPIALCEVQGYVYSALKNAAYIARKLDHKDMARDLAKKAQKLKKKFNSAFWDEELRTFVIALDGENEKCRVKSSNAGQCLFTEIVDNKYAGILSEVLMDPDMFSGWGIRTLSSESVRYNPMSYHNGSVWPHDTALVAYGLAKYGFKKETLKIFNGLFEASFFFEMQRLPELFCGFPRKNGEMPVEYPVACSPQAWSVAAIYILIKACLGIEINAVERKIYFNRPFLPAFIEDMKITNLILDGDTKTEIKIKNYITDVGISVNRKDHNWEIVIVK